MRILSRFNIFFSHRTAASKAHGGQFVMISKLRCQFLEAVGTNVPYPMQDAQNLCDVDLIYRVSVTSDQSSINRTARLDKSSAENRNPRELDTARLPVLLCDAEKNLNPARPASRKLASCSLPAPGVSKYGFLLPRCLLPAALPAPLPAARPRFLLASCCR